MRRLLLTAALATLPAIAAAEAGIGASLRDTDATLFLPIEGSATVRTEPFFAWSDQELDTTVGVTEKSMTFGLGLFRKFEIRDRTQVYAGGRVGFVKFEGHSPTQDLETDGFSLEPVLGIEYRPVDVISVSLEALVFYRKVSGDFGADDYDEDILRTSNRILLRAYFPP